MALHGGTVNVGMWNIFYFPLVYLVLLLLLLRVVVPDHRRHNTDTEWEGALSAQRRLHSSPVSARTNGPLIGQYSPSRPLIGCPARPPASVSSPQLRLRLRRCSEAPGPHVQVLPMQVITSNLAKWHSLTEQIQTEYYTSEKKKMNTIGDLVWDVRDCRLVSHVHPRLERQLRGI